MAGVGERTCLDRGGAIKGRRLDVYIADRSEALRFGRKKALVLVRVNE
ncbi:3D domain-containing protein [Brevibacillus borstelensis]|nr:3D domain-containing protein [Brevibacillus borstelensis]WNF08390.1 3D domain-containing protein [Brevibacillus borstelensis]